jgi:hypothetical protein
MLKDRQVLLEQEIAKAHDKAAVMYLDIVTHDRDVHSAEYQDIRNKIMNLEIDLSIITKLIRSGHK